MVRVIKDFTSRLRSIRSRNPQIQYDFRDEFIAPLLPGAVNGTLAEPGPGTRTVVDSANRLSITDGRLVMNGGAAVLVQNDPSLSSIVPITRDPGKIGIFGVVANGSQLVSWGFDNDIGGAVVQSAFYRNIQILDNNISIITHSMVAGVNYKTATILRAAGQFSLLRTEDGLFKLLWIGSGDVSNPVYFRISGYDGLFIFDFAAMPTQLWMPEPLLSDGFALASQPAAIDYGGVSNGVYGLVGLDGSSRKALYNGTNSYCNIYSAALNNKLNKNELTVIARCKISAATWVDGADRAVYSLYVDANNLHRVLKSSVANRISCLTSAGGVLTTINTVALGGTTNWFTVGHTFSDVGNTHRLYLNGVEDPASPLANAGVFVGNLNSNNTAFGITSIGGYQPWSGALSDGIVLYNVVATAAQMLAVHQQLATGTLTEEYLNTTFGAGTWSWWKMDEQFASDGLGHAEGVAGGIGAGGAGLKYTIPFGVFDYSANTIRCSVVDASGAIMAVDCKSMDVLITASATRVGGNVGLVARYKNTTNYLIAYHDGANCQLAKVVSGVTTVVITAVAAYVAGAQIRLILEGDQARLYYNNGLVGTGTVAESLLINPTPLHGVYSSAVGNTLDDLTIYARGTGGEYEYLEQF